MPRRDQQPLHLRRPDDRQMIRTIRPQSRPLLHNFRARKPRRQFLRPLQNFANALRRNLLHEPRIFQSAPRNDPSIAPRHQITARRTQYLLQLHVRGSQQRPIGPAPAAPARNAPNFPPPPETQSLIVPQNAPAAITTCSPSIFSPPAVTPVHAPRSHSSDSTAQSPRISAPRRSAASQDRLRQQPRVHRSFVRQPSRRAHRRAQLGFQRRAPPPPKSFRSQAPARDTPRSSCPAHSRHRRLQIIRTFLHAQNPRFVPDASSTPATNSG